MLLSLMGTLVSIQAAKLIRAYRFDQEVGQFFTALQEAQALAVTYATDHTLDIAYEQGAFYYQISTDEPFSSHILNQKKIPLKGVRQILFNGRKQKKLHFDIIPSGSVEPRGILLLRAEEDTQKRFLDLQGGVLIKCSASVPARQNQKIPEKPRSKGSPKP